MRRARAHRLGEVRDPDADQPTVSARLYLFGTQRLVADLVEGSAQRGGIVARVVDETGRRGVRELEGLDELLEPEIGGSDAQLVCGGLHESLDEERRLGDAERAAIRDAARRLVRERTRARDVRGGIVVTAGDDMEEPGA